MDTKIITLNPGQSIIDIYDANNGIIEDDDTPDYEEELIIEKRGNIDVSR